MSIEKSPLVDDEATLRFGGIARLYGNTALQTFSQAHVTIIGMGGVGSWTAEALARSGVGHLTLIDLDDICLSNTNRQIHALNGCYGKLKIDVMGERIKAINPACQLTLVEDFVTLDRLAHYLPPQTHYVIDAIDSVKIKVGIITHCHQFTIPLLVVGGAGGQIDPTQIRLTDLAFARQDPLLAKIRAALRRHHGFPRDINKKFKVDCVYSEESLRYPQSNGTISTQKRPRDVTGGINCQTGMGASVSVTGTFGFFASAHVLKKLAIK